MRLKTELKSNNEMAEAERMVGFFINFSENQNIEYTKKSLVQATDEVQRMGGPRDGKGGAVAAAMCAAAIGCNAWAKDEGLLN